MQPVDPRVLRVIPEARPIMAGLGAVGIAQGVLAVAQAFAVSHLVVTVVRPGDPGALRAAMVWVGFVLAARGVLGWTAQVYAARAGLRVSASVRERLLARWLGMPLDGLSAPAEAATLATQGATTIEPYIARFLPALVGAVVLPIGVVATILTLDWVSALIVVLTVPLLPVFAALIGRATADETEKRWQALRSLAGHYLDVVRGLPTLVAYGRADRQGATIRQVSERHREATMATLRIAFLSSAALELLASVSVAIVAVTVGLRLTNGTMDLAAGLVCILLAPEAYWPIRRVGAEYHAAADGAAALTAALDELTAETESLVPGNEGFNGSLTITIDQLTYAYPGSERAVIESLDLSLTGPGLVAITGPSGVGKTTLLELIAGLRRPSQGRVVCQQESGRAAVHVVSQRPLIVAATLRDNLTLGTSDTRAPGRAPDDDEAQRQALRNLLTRVGLPAELLDSPLGDDGFGLSAGQRARLALGRALLSDAPIVLLDEPTAHLDPDSVTVAHEIIAELARARLVVVVTHRPELLALADHHVELADPRVDLAGRRVDLADHHVELTNRYVELTDPCVPPAAVSPTSPSACLPSEPLDRPSNASQATPSRVKDDRHPSSATPTQRPPVDPFTVTAPGVRGAAILGGLATASGIALTATSGWLIVAASHQPVILTLLAVIVSVRTFGIARPVLRYAERIRSHSAALDLLARRRVTAYEALVPLTPARLGRRSRASVLTGVVEDLEDHVFATVRVRVPVIGAVIAGAIAVAALAIVMPAGALVVAALLGAHALVARRGHRLEVTAQTTWLRARAEIARITSLVTGYAGELRGLGGGQQALAWVRDAHGDLARASARLARANGSTVALGHIVTAVGTLAAAAVASWAVSIGVSDAVAAVVVLVPLAIGEGFVGLPDAMSAWARADGSKNRLRDLLAQPPAVTDPSGTDRTISARQSATSNPGGAGAERWEAGATNGADGIPAGVPELELRGLGARWSATPDAQLDLAATTLRIPPGEHLVLTGANGAGKSTLLAVLARYLDPAVGSYSMGGHDVRTVPLAATRSRLAIVDDEPHIFASTLRESLRLARPLATDEDLIGALTLAGLTSWYAALPAGLDTMLGTGGRGVSGGERARLAVARAHVSGRPIVLLDEPVAHLDHATAVEVLRDVRRGFAGRTVVMVSHRPDGVDDFDRVIDLGSDASDLGSAASDLGSDE